MAEIIDLKNYLKQRDENNLDKIKEELMIELERLDFSIEKELNKYVIFDTSMYYELSKEDNTQVTRHNTMKHLLTSFDMLVKLNEEQAAIEVENVITRLENNSYYGSKDDSN